MAADTDLQVKLTPHGDVVSAMVYVWKCPTRSSLAVIIGQFELTEGEVAWVEWSSRPIEKGDVNTYDYTHRWLPGDIFSFWSKDCMRILIYRFNWVGRRTINSGTPQQGRGLVTCVWLSRIVRR